MISINRRWRTRGIAFLLGAWQCVAVAAEGPRRLDLTVVTTHPPSLPWVSVIRDHVLPEFSRRLAQVAPDLVPRYTTAWGTLYKWHDSLAGVEIGLADIGWVGSLWESARLPLQNVTYAVPFITDDLPALLRVMNRLHADVPALAASWEQCGARFLGASGVDTYHLLTTFPVRGLDDLRGRRILAPGAAATWLQGTGAIAVDGSLSSYYMQLKTGVADGVLSILTGAHPYRLHEVAPHVTLVGLGAQFTGALTANLRTWRRLPPAAQDILAALGHEYSERAAAEVVARYAGVLEALAAEGARITRLPATEKQRWIEALPDPATRWIARNEAQGLPARLVLVSLLDGLRRQGVEPIHAWDDPFRAGAPHEP